jgi:hypothetical protein
MDFSLQKYADLLKTIQDSGRTVKTLAEFLESGQPEGALVLRHDVDRRVKNALRLARLEAQMGVKASYYVRTVPSVFIPEAIQTLYKDGHEVGFHYETLCKTQGDLEKAFELFKQELSTLRQYTPVKTICMHGSPFFPWDNRDLWKTYDFTSLGLAGEAYLSIDYSKVYYFTDVSRSWDAGKTNIRDHTAGLSPDKPVRTTDDLITFLKEKRRQTIIISTHPERWEKDLLPWMVSLLMDKVVSLGKKVYLLNPKAKIWSYFTKASGKW